MNRRIIFYMLGKITLLEGALLLLPMAVAIFHGENCAFSLLISSIIALLLGGGLTAFSKPSSRHIFAKEGLLIAALSWIIVSVIGALPFVISGEIPSFIDALFETVSGFTTTGASILTDIEKMSRGLLFWRSFTHWIGGMGVLVLVMALVPSDSGRSMHILRAEMPGPIIEKIAPTIRSTAKILYLIYLFMTVLQIVLLCVGGMPLFESIIHTFGTAGTGGFGVKSDSIAGYSPYLQWVITIFMILFGVNFNIYNLILLKKFKNVLKNAEIYVYLTIILFSTILITVNTLPYFDNLSDGIRHSAFQVSSIITTTGYSTVDYNLWPSFSKILLIFLMFIGGCAGSTAGGLKVSRVIIIFKVIKQNLKRVIHPHAVSSIKLDGHILSDGIQRGVFTYFSLYMIIYSAILLILCIEPFDITTNLSAAAACLNNVGPGLNLVGPASNFSCYSDFSTFILTIAMLIGRLEIYPILFLFSPFVWSKK